MPFVFVVAPLAAEVCAACTHPLARRAALGMSGFLARVCAFAIGVSAGCGTGMTYLHGDMHRAHAAVGRSVDALAASLGQAPASTGKGAVVAASAAEGAAGGADAICKS